MTSIAAISETEVRAIQEGIVHDTRADGRTLLQRRPVHIELKPRHDTASAFAREADTATTTVAAEGTESYDGSSVVVTLATTTVLAASSPSVVEVTPENEGGGVLYISIDAAPTVVDLYAGAMGGRQASYRRAYLDSVASVMREVFGAHDVTVQESAGVAEARVVTENADETASEDEESASVRATTKTTTTTTTPYHTTTGFPAAALYLGRGFAFRLDVDVHVRQAMAGNVLTCVALAVHAALRSTRLPAVTLHESATGVSVEVDRSRPYDKVVDWSRLPVLALCLLSPTRHYVVDPTAREELALPRQLQVAANAGGEVVFSRYQQLPSRRGDELLAGAHDARRDAKRPRVETDAAATTDLSAAHEARACATELHLTDWLAVVGDAVHVCQAMIADCDALFGPAPTV